MFSKYFGKYYGIKSTTDNFGDLSGFKMEFWKNYMDFQIFFAFEIYLPSFPHVYKT